MAEFNTPDTNPTGNDRRPETSLGARSTQAAGIGLQTLGNLYATTAQNSALARQATIRFRSLADQSIAALMNSRAQQALNNINASRADLEAWYMQADLRVQVAQTKRAGERQTASMAAAIGASGIRLEDSALDAMTESAFQGEYAVRRSLAVGNRAITAKQTEAADLREQGMRVRQEGLKAFNSLQRSSRAQYKSFLAQSRASTIQAIFQGVQGASQGAAMGFGG